MARHRGRPLERDEVVNHVDGNRTDDRLENLELWSTAHPKGQRTDDEVGFAVEMLRRDAPELRADQGGASAVSASQDPGHYDRGPRHRTGNDGVLYYTFM